MSWRVSASFRNWAESTTTRGAHYDEIEKLFERFAQEREQLAFNQRLELFGAMERAFLDVGNTSGIKYLGISTSALD